MADCCRAAMQRRLRRLATATNGDDTARWRRNSANRRRRSSIWVSELGSKFWGERERPRESRRRGRSWLRRAHLRREFQGWWLVVSAPPSEAVLNCLVWGERNLEKRDRETWEQGQHMPLILFLSFIVSFCVGWTGIIKNHQGQINPWFKYGQREWGSWAGFNC